MGARCSGGPGAIASVAPPLNRHCVGSQEARRPMQLHRFKAGTEVPCKRLRCLRSSAFYRVPALTTFIADPFTADNLRNGSVMNVVCCEHGLL